MFYITTHCSNGCVVACVGNRHDHAVPGSCTDLSGGSLGSFAIAGNDGDGHPLCRKGFHDGKPNATASASHDRLLSSQAKFHAL
jgi:hypothetical protein